MTHRKRTSTLAIVAMLSLMLTSLVGSPAEAKPGKGKDKVSYGTTSWVAGTSGYAIKGKASGPRRKVALQVKWADGWHTIDKTRTKRKGKYRFTQTRGSVLYVFRALIKKQGGYPYSAGASRKAKVLVRG